MPDWLSVRVYLGFQLVLHGILVVLWVASWLMEG